MSHCSTPNGNKMSKLSLLATYTSAVKGNYVYSSGIGIGALLFCELEFGAYIWDINRVTYLGGVYSGDLICGWRINGI